MTALGPASRGGRCGGHDRGDDLRKWLRRIDQHSADLATFLARHLGFADRVQVIHDRSTKIDLPEPADVLVTEAVTSSVNFS